MLGLGLMGLAVVVPMMVVMSVPGVLVVVRRPMIMPVVLAISLVLMVGECGGRHGAGRCGRPPLEKSLAEERAEGSDDVRKVAA